MRYLHSAIEIADLDHNIYDVSRERSYNELFSKIDRDLEFDALSSMEFRLSRHVMDEQEDLGNLDDEVTLEEMVSKILGNTHKVDDVGDYGQSSLYITDGHLEYIMSTYT